MKRKKINKEIKRLQNLFWDYNWDSVLKNLSSPYVIARVLEIGDEEQLKLFRKEIGDDVLKDFLKNYGERLLSKISYNFWKCYCEKKFIK